MATVSKKLAPVTIEAIRNAVGEAAFAVAVTASPSKPDPTKSKAVRLSDGEGLYLIVEPTGSARWIFLFRWAGKLKEMGLGGLSKVNLKAARAKALTARGQLGDNINPIEAKRADRAVPIFGDLADDLITEIGKGFKNPKHLDSWQRAIGAPRIVKRRTGVKWIEDKPRPSFAERLRPMRVDEISTSDVLAVLKPVWGERHETASRLRGQIAQVLDAAKAAGHRSGENPAAWTGNLKHMLAARKKLTKGHHAALPYADLPKFMTALRTRPAQSAKSLEFLILTTARAGEVLGMTWAEVDTGATLWTVPAARMKGGKEHRVPLSDPAVKVINEMALGAKKEPAALVFPGLKANRPLSQATLGRLVERMGYSEITVHGFRSTFRDWCGDATSFPRDLAEQALAHAVTNQVEAAYRRSDALERRRKMMDAWATFCGGGGTVVELVKSA